MTPSATNPGTRTSDPFFIGHMVMPLEAFLSAIKGSISREMQEFGIDEAVADRHGGVARDFIASAPDLLRAAKLMLLAVDTHNGDFTSAAQYAQAVEALRAAIRRATGERG